MAKACCGVIEKKGFFSSLKWMVICLIVGLVSLVVSYFVWGSEHLGHKEWFMAMSQTGQMVFMVLNPAWIVIITCGAPLFKGAFVNLFRNGKIVSALLIVTAMVACIVMEVWGWFSHSHGGGHHNHSYIFIAGEVAYLMMIGSAIEDFTVKKTNSGIQKLIELAPKTALIKMNGEFSELPVIFVQVGDIALIKPNQIISVDGVIVKGNTSINQSAITGESQPQDKTVGENVWAGTTNLSGAIEVRVTHLSNETTVSKMVKMVEESQLKKAPIARIADKWAGYIVPAAIGLSLLVFIVDILLGFVFHVEGYGWIQSISNAITVLVVFCPCSLALATPTAIASGVGNCAMNGIMVKSGQALESLAKVDTVCFDKTGTITCADIAVNDYVSSLSKEEFFMLAGSAENESEHPLAVAIVEYAKSITTLVPATSTHSLVGVGVSAKINGKTVSVVKADKLDLSIEFTARKEEWQNRGETVVGVTLDDNIIGLISLSDKIRDGIKEAVLELKKINIQPCMLTGDNYMSAKAVADSVGITEFKSDLMPEDKVSFVEELKASGKTVLMVGDGVNDAPALACADTSVAIKALNNTIALEVAEIAVLNSDVSKLPWIVKFSKKVLFTIKRNIVMAMVINIIAVCLSALSLLTPMWGALIHNCSSIFVVASSALLLLYKRK